MIRIQWQVAKPFPIVVMSEKGKYLPSLVEIIIEQFGIQYFHTIFSFSKRDPVEIQCFDKTIAEVFIEFSCNQFTFFSGLFGKRIGQIVCHNISAIPNKIVAKKIKEV